MRSLAARRACGVVVITMAVLAVEPAAAQPIACSEPALRAAINAAGTGATITVPDLCTITLTGSPGEENSATGDLDININTGAASLTIQGAGSGRSILDGGGVDRVLDIAAGKAVTVKNLTIRNGDATPTPERGGGGIYKGA